MRAGDAAVSCVLSFRSGKAHSGVNGRQVQRRTHAVCQQVKLLLTVLFHGDEVGPGRVDPLLSAQKSGQFFGQFAGVEQPVQVGAEHIALHTALRRAVCKGAERTAPHLGAACVDLVARERCPGKGANKRIRRSTEETFQQTVTGYDSVKVDNSSIQLHGGKAKYALFPVWLLSTSWRGENYLFAMNGQTGKFVGDLPVDKGAARKWMLGLTAALSAASYGVMWLLWLARIL